MNTSLIQPETSESLRKKNKIGFVVTIASFATMFGLAALFYNVENTRIIFASVAAVFVIFAIYIARSDF